MFFSFPDIGQFRQAIRAVKQKVHKVGVDANGDNIYDGSIPLPKIKYRGTCKLHGCNASVAIDLNTKEIQIQSRENIITPEKDNYGFARFIIENNIASLFDFSNVSAPVANPDEAGKAIVFGEWCGGNIQKGVALSELGKMFVIFSIRVNGTWLSEEVVKQYKFPDKKVFNINDYPSFVLDIDFQNPELIQNTLVDITLGVEKECPVGKAFLDKMLGDNVAHQNDNGEIWFDRDMGFSRCLREFISPYFDELRAQNQKGTISIRFMKE